MPPQHETCKQETSSTIPAAMVSPSSMPSELNMNVAMNNSNNRNSQKFQAPSWDKDRLFLEDLRDVMAFLKMQEASYHRRTIRKRMEHQRRTQNFHGGKMSNLPPFHDDWRPVMISWMHHVADTFRLMPIVVATGVYILDTCAVALCNPSSPPHVQKELYPLMTMTALNMAVKCHETKMFPLDQLVQLLGKGGGSSAEESYTPDDICAMERRLLHRCGWKLHCPTTHDFLLRFVTVLAQGHQASVTSSAVMYLKQSLMWEHVLHQEKKEDGLFSTCTLAYAAFLLAMESAGLPLADKQAACLALLEVANLSAQTPQLPEAYNWLIKAKSLQVQLERGNSLRQASSVANEKAPPVHSSSERQQEDTTVDLLDDISTDQMSCDTGQSHLAPSSCNVAIVEPDSDDENVVPDDHSTSMMSYGSVISEHSVIFCSYSSDGDAVEVVATDISVEEEEEDADDESMDHSATVTVLPTVVEEEEQEPAEGNPAFVAVDDCEEDEDEPERLVLSESLDEDGFEVAIQSKNADSLANLVTSPREVSAAL